jgi:hypothetical protein
MDTITLVFFTLLGGGLLIAFIIEVFELKGQKQAFETWSALINDYIESYEELKKAINTNANLLRVAGETINDHDRVLRVMSIVVDTHSEILKLNPQLRDQLEHPPVDGFIVTVGEDVE